MNKILPTLAVGAALAGPAAALAQAPATPQSPHTVTGNVGFVTDYRFRGISQTFRQPAIQGGVDYSHASGLYLGTWASNVYGNGAAVGNPIYQGGSMEWDFYGGYKWEVAKDLNLDVGLLYYWYPNARYPVATKEKYNNTEIYLGASYKWFSAKYSHTLSDFFGFNQNTAVGCGVSTSGVVFTAANAPDGCATANGGSRGSGYLDLNGTFEVADKTNLIVHVGHQSVRHYSQYAYTDYKIGVTREWAGFTWGASYIGTNARKSFYTVAETQGGGTNVEGKKVGEGTLVLSVLKTF